MSSHSNGLPSMIAPPPPPPPKEVVTEYIVKGYFINHKTKRQLDCFGHPVHYKHESYYGYLVCMHDKVFFIHFVPYNGAVMVELDAWEYISLNLI